MKTLKDSDFEVECNVCKTRIKNHFGSTPCCGAVAWMVDKDGNTTTDMVLLGSVNNMPIKPLLISTK